MAGEFLPPVVTRLTGDLSDLARTVADAKALIASIEGKSITVEVNTRGITGPVRGAIAQITALKAAMAGLDDKTVKLGVDSGAGGIVGSRVLAGIGGARFGGLLTAGNIFTVLHLLLAGFASQVIADTIGIVAFGAAMYSFIGDTYTAASSVKNLTTQYAGLDNYQKAAALSIKAFTDGLQSADEAGLLGVFYQGLALVQGELGKSGSIVTQATNAFGDLFGMLKGDFTSKAWSDLLSSNVNIIRTDLDALFRLINSGINVIPGLFHNFNFLGVAVLDVASGFLRAVAAVTEWNPALTKAVALAGVAAGLYKVLWAGLGPGPGILQRATMGVIGFGRGVARAASYMSEGVGVAASYVPGLGALLALLNPLTLGFGALAVGIGAVAYIAITSKDPILQQIASIQKQDVTVSNSIAQWQAFQGQMKGTLAEIGNIAPWASGTAGANDYRNAIDNAQGTINRIMFNSEQFGKALGVTAQEARIAATATGVDLTKSIRAGGPDFAAAAFKIQGYVQAVRLSHSPLSQLKVDAQQASSAANSLSDQVKALGAAFNSLLGPYQNVIQGNVTFRDDLVTLKKDLSGSGNQVGYWDAAVRKSAQGMATAVSDAIGLSNAIKTQTGSTALAVGPLQTMIGFLRSTGSQSAITRREIQLLQQTIDALHGKMVNVGVAINYTTTGSPGPINVSGSTFHHMASGGTARPGWAIVGEGRPGSTPELVHFHGGETVIPNHMLSSGPRPPVSGGSSVTEIHLFLDGREIFPAVQQETYEYNVANGNRDSRGRVRGVLVPR